MPQHVPFRRPAAADLPLGELSDWLALARRLTATAGLVRRALTGREEYNETEQLVLWHCSLEPEAGLGQSELVAAVGCSPAQISGTVETLRKAGQLRASRSPHDRRRQLWSLTTAGRATIDQWHAPQSAAVAELSGRLPVESLANLSGLLARFEIEATPPKNREAA